MSECHKVKSNFLNEPKNKFAFMHWPRWGQIHLFVAVDDVPRLVVDGVFAVSLGGGALPTSWEGSAFERSTYSGISISCRLFQGKVVRGG